MVNDKQKIAVLDVNASTQTTIESKLVDGYVITHIVYIQSLNKLLIIYATPDII